MPTYGRLLSTNDFKISGELDETQVLTSKLSFDALGNFRISGAELIERQDAVANGVSYSETTQTEFNSGTLTSVVGKTDGTLQLAGETSATYPSAISGTYSTGAYGIGFTVNEPVILNGWKSDFSNTTSQTINFALYSGYTWGENLTLAGRTAYKTYSLVVPSAGVRTVTGMNWLLPKGTYWFGITNTTGMTGCKRNNAGTWGGPHPKTSTGGTITSIKACRNDGYTVGQDNWYYVWSWELLLNTTGNRVSNPIDVSSITNASNSVISWNATVPTGSTLTIETSLNNGTTWTAVTNGGAIAGITTGTDLTGKSLLIRQSYTLGTSTTSPSLQDLTFTINQAVVQTAFTVNLDATDFEVNSFEEGVIF